MGRYRSRSRSYSPRRYSPSPPPRSKHYDDPRDRYRSSGRGGYRDRRSPAPSGLLIRNISLDARPDDLRVPFERFGPVKDVYLPKNYYTGEPRGFGFVKFRNAEDAYEAKQHLNHQVIGGREITIVFAEENRKTPQEMRLNARVSGRYMGNGYGRRSRSPRRRYRSYSRSRSPVRYGSRDHHRGEHDDYYSPHRSISPSRRSHPDRRREENGRSGSREENGRSGSHEGNGRSPYERSPSRSRSYSPRR